MIYNALVRNYIHSPFGGFVGPALQSRLVKRTKAWRIRYKNEVQNGEAKLEDRCNSQNLSGSFMPASFLQVYVNLSMEKSVILYAHVNKNARTLKEKLGNILCIPVNHQQIAFADKESGEYKMLMCYMAKKVCLQELEIHGFMETNLEASSSVQRTGETLFGQSVLKTQDYSGQRKFKRKFCDRFCSDGEPDDELLFENPSCGYDKILSRKGEEVKMKKCKIAL